MSSSTSGQDRESARSPEQDPPYTVTQDGDRITVRFTSGEMQGQILELSKQQLERNRDRNEDGSAHRAQADAQSEKGLPEVSILDGKDQEISQEEYDRLAALENEEEARRHAARSR